MTRHESEEGGLNKNLTEIDNIYIFLHSISFSLVNPDSICFILMCSDDDVYIQTHHVFVDLVYCPEF
jgi:hypothetical protein